MLPKNPEEEEAQLIKDNLPYMTKGRPLSSIYCRKCWGTHEIWVGKGWGLHHKWAGTGNKCSHSCHLDEKYNVKITTASLDWRDSRGA